MKKVENLCTIQCRPNCKEAEQRRCFNTLHTRIHT